MLIHAIANRMKLDDSTFHASDLHVHEENHDKACQRAELVQHFNKVMLY